MKGNEIARLGLIIVAACVFIYLIHEYNSDGNNKVNNSNNGNNANALGPVEGFYDAHEEMNNVAQGPHHSPSSDEEDASGSEEEPENEDGENGNGEDNVEGFFGDGERTAEDPVEMSDGSSEDETLDGPMPGEANGNSTFKTVAQGNNNDNANQNPNRLPNECYPRDVLTPQDLLPQDSNSTWAQTVPSGQGSLGDQNFLNAGFHVGINTVGQSLRNANMQLRSEPANPQLKVSPWLQTTIEPDINRRAMEIGA
jgi:hypothetical protein